MNDTPLLLRELGKRAIPAGICFAVGAAILLFGSKESLGIDPVKALVAITGIGFLLAGSILLAPTLARIVAQPSGNVFYPLERYSKPQPVYSIPRRQRLEGKFHEALQGYLAILDEHPEELPAYIELIDLASRDLNDDSLAESIFARGMEALKEEKDRQALQHKYQDSALGHTLPLTN